MTLKKQRMQKQDIQDILNTSIAVLSMANSELVSSYEQINTMFDRMDRIEPITATSSRDPNFISNFIPSHNKLQEIQKKLSDVLDDLNALSSTLQDGIIGDAEVYGMLKRIKMGADHLSKSLDEMIELQSLVWHAAAYTRLVEGWNYIYNSIKRECYRISSLFAQETIDDTAEPDTTEPDTTEPNVIFSASIKCKTKQKKISVVCGDICESKSSFDVVACSSFKNAYAPAPGTFIGNLQFKKGISVQELSQNCALDLRAQGGWLSHEVDSNIKRIACVELLECRDADTTPIDEAIILKSAFSTLCFLLEQASIRGIKVQNVALPILGTGQQKIELEYIANPLTENCLKALNDIDDLEEIIFYELSREKAKEFASVLSNWLDDKPDEEGEELFISYSSEQTELAEELYKKLTDAGFSCWMAKESISVSESYLEEIPKAIKNAKALVLILTPASMVSVWVRKEVASSAGANKVIIPCKLGNFELDDVFSFLLNDIQIINVTKEGLLKSNEIVYKIKSLLGSRNTVGLENQTKTVKKTRRTKPSKNKRGFLRFIKWVIGILVVAMIVYVLHYFGLVDFLGDILEC